MSTLIAFADNDGPQPRKQGYVTSTDGFDLRYAIFRSPVRPNKGSIVLLHGRNECIEKYLETVADLMDLGFDVCTFDWRGQGRSTRFFADHKRGHVDDFGQYVADLDQVFTEAFLAESRSPYFIVAHSMGALVALAAAPVMNNRIDRMVLSAPLLGLSPDWPAPGLLSVLTRGLCFFGLGMVYAGPGPRGFAALELATNRLTTDPVRFARNQAILDPEKGLGLGAATVGWLRAAIRAIGHVHSHEHMARVHIPTLMVVAGADRVVSIGAIEHYARSIRAGTLITITGARHELMQEADVFREQFLAAVEAFLPGSDG
ncbi:MULTISPECIES: alpha/beta hydrolase [unclassified Roseitalea]|uniref:alpha/beta fold hydrolase n=1 Tax=unclassified Roseitalea TaxID=2639107 RepID=UPI00273EE50A|nr:MULTISPECIES: alpha/beta hydrolase [unclassified Roseitalea]